DWDLGVYDESKGIFGVGNVVTGKGNIRASLLHSQYVCNYLKENYFRGALGAASAEAVQQHLESIDPLPAEQVAAIQERVGKLQKRIDYSDYETWIKANTPADLE
ncbi:MAG: hypothetical protein OER88_06715, partial [Planctomycetota bacterium]|nr:hypothetical protein [Planctomycetota bacterium]